MADIQAGGAMCNHKGEQRGHPLCADAFDFYQIFTNPLKTPDKGQPNR